MTEIKHGLKFIQNFEFFTKISNNFFIILSNIKFGFFYNFLCIFLGIDDIFDMLKIDKIMIQKIKNIHKKIKNNLENKSRYKNKKK